MQRIECVCEEFILNGSYESQFFSGTMEKHMTAVTKAPSDRGMRIRGKPLAEGVDKEKQRVKKRKKKNLAVDQNESGL
jgi:hypothetical protein